MKEDSDSPDCALLSTPLRVSIIGDKGTEEPRPWILRVIKHGAVTKSQHRPLQKNIYIVCVTNTALLCHQHSPSELKFKY